MAIALPMASFIVVINPMYLSVIITVPSALASMSQLLMLIPRTEWQHSVNNSLPILVL